MSKKLFVGSLPWAMNDEALKEAFASHGNVISANIVTDRQTDDQEVSGLLNSKTIPKPLQQLKH